MMKEFIYKRVVLLLMPILVINPAAGKCVLGDGLLNPLVGPSGVQQKGNYEAEENVFGWSSGPIDGIVSNLTDSELKDCLREYDKGATTVGGKPLPPGVTPEKDPSRQPYLPPASGKDVLINDNGKGNGHGEYYTTYDGSKYKFKEKGYVIDAPTSDSTSGKPSPAPTSNPKPSSPGETKPKPLSPPSASAPTTTQPGKGSNKKHKDELQQWYNAFVSVMSKYV